MSFIVDITLRVLEYNLPYGKGGESPDTTYDPCFFAFMHIHILKLERFLTHTRQTQNRTAVRNRLVGHEYTKQRQRPGK